MKKNYFLSAVASAFMLTTTAVMAQTPTNDNCSGAKVLTVSADTTCHGMRDSLAGATSSGAPSNCNNAPSQSANDVWYSFVATATTQLVRVTPDSMALVASLYSSCGGTELQCANPRLGSFGGTHFAFRGPLSFLAKNLTAGSTYYIRLYQFTGPFNTEKTVGTGFTICVTTPTLPPAPANDLCANAINVVPSTDTICVTPVNGTALGATQTAAPENCDGTNTSSQANDVWYKFTATSTKHVIDVTSNKGVVVGLYNTCGGAVVTCTNPNFTFGIPRPGKTSVKADNLTVGTIYFVRIYGYNSEITDSVNFTVCIHKPKPPLPNDLCAGAINVIADLTDTCTNPINVKIDGANHESAAMACNGTPASTTSDDVWYKFKAISDAMDIEATTQFFIHNYGVEVELYDGSSGTCGNFLQCQMPRIRNGQSTPGQTKMKVFGLTIGKTYFVRLYPFSDPNSGANPFTLCIHKDSTGTTTGINDISNIEKTMNLYPNPAKDQLHVSFTANSTVSVRIASVTGVLVYAENPINVNGTFERNIDISNFAKGIYILQITTDKQSINRKVVKE